GDELAARFPLRAANPATTRQLLEDEARASAEFARHSPFPAPVPVAIGHPGGGYPLPWSVQTWLPGAVATEDDPSGSVEFAHDLAALVAALRTVDTGGRGFQGDNRGGDLHDHDGWVETCLRKSQRQLDVSRLAVMWRYFRDLPRTSPDVMTHGDLIPANVLVADGRLAGVLDCGGFGPADPALDVIAGWHLLDDRPRAVFRAELGCDDLEWERSKAWAFEQAMGAVWYYADTNAAMSTMGHRTLGRIVADTPI
ncbi:MAG TPA: aminoglycoside phosphotransferase family protein, partial [Acidimicrobiales bacterium]|nr:aminoglycoside phosphotransferase family protein [Acidimicrobiales bacterium]